MISPPVWQHRTRRVDAHRTVRSAVADRRAVAELQPHTQRNQPQCTCNIKCTSFGAETRCRCSPLPALHSALPLRRCHAAWRELSACSEFAPSNSDDSDSSRIPMSVCLYAASCRFDSLKFPRLFACCDPAADLARLNAVAAAVVVCSRR